MRPTSSTATTTTTGDSTKQPHQGIPKRVLINIGNTNKGIEMTLKEINNQAAITKKDLHSKWHEQKSKSDVESPLVDELKKCQSLSNTLVNQFNLLKQQVEEYKHHQAKASGETDKQTKDLIERIDKYMADIGKMLSNLGELLNHELNEFIPSEFEKMLNKAIACINNLAQNNDALTFALSDHQPLTNKSEDAVSLEYEAFDDINLARVPLLLKFIVEMHSPDVKRQADHEAELADVVRRGKSAMNHAFRNSPPLNDPKDQFKAFIMYTLEKDILYVNSIMWNRVSSSWDVTHNPMPLDSIASSGLQQNTIHTALGLIQLMMEQSEADIANARKATLQSGTMNAPNVSASTIAKASELEHGAYMLIDEEQLRSCYKSLSDKMSESLKTKSSMNLLFLKAARIIADHYSDDPGIEQFHKNIILVCQMQIDPAKRERLSDVDHSNINKLIINSSTELAAHYFASNHFEKALGYIQIAVDHGFYDKQMAERIFVQLEASGKGSGSAPIGQAPSLNSDAIKDLVTTGNVATFIAVATTIGSAYKAGMAATKQATSTINQQQQPPQPSLSSSSNALFGERKDNHQTSKTSTSTNSAANSTSIPPRNPSKQ